MATSRARSPIVSAALLVATIVIGLGSRRYSAVLPAILAKNAGDILWDTAVYFLLAITMPRTASRLLLIASWGIGASVELFKLYDPIRLHTFRHTAIGGLLLGHAFSWSNPICYAIGAGIGFGIDTILRRYSGPKADRPV